MKKKKIIGLILVLIGVLLIMNNAGLIEFDLRAIISMYWPVILILAGVFNILGNPAAKKGGIILLIVGLLFQLSKLGYFNIFEYLSFWPVIIIIAGLYFVFPEGDQGKGIDKDSFNTINLFSGANNRLLSKDFKGGSSIVAFGGVEIDLSKAEIKGKEARIDVFAAFGGIEIVVPESWNVVIKGLPIFAGWDNNTADNDNPEAPTLVVNCLLLFGGVEVKNQ
ncbi:LiaI-LiaF-like domain-containing protein [Fuchsiella alkaliacetigena]|uniref:LiaI-LiaF-like domain-containing protein n=1 Tax=Fuchsiella alkaliacetigena TaxID=957042 RepID=UPI00200AE5AD|nr:DUF5668 domain-containing protein [Fuchsiella alkaliacetigena]MCK8825743.1 cell wall-active antibiotics response protein [Fuchsiella alkaliacetigena]